jgi:hypothetical protein
MSQAAHHAHGDPRDAARGPREADGAHLDTGGGATRHGRDGRAHPEHAVPAAADGRAGHGAHTGPAVPAAADGRAGHGAHSGHEGHRVRATWGTAASATLHCLTGCAIGEILGMVIGTALAWQNVPTMLLAIALAFVFGYSLTVLSLRRARLGWRRTVRLALAADTLSIAVMELVDNGVILAIPGALDAHLTSPLFWGSLAISLVVAFVVTTPVNRWFIGRGRGHAVIHSYH